MATKKKPPTQSPRPEAESPAPSTIRVDPESAFSLELIERHPNVPTPVLSTMALEHGKDAVGAEGIKEGFAWNAQMDLLWALGYPHVVLIADGLPEGEDQASLIEHWYGKGRGGWITRSKLASKLVIPRRGAHALLYDLESGEDPFNLSAEEFQKVTESRDLDTAATAALLRKVRSSLDLDRAALILEALVGPSAVAEALCGIAEDPKFDEMPNEFRGRAVSACQPVLRRLPKVDSAKLRARFAAIERVADDGFDSFLRGAQDPLGDAEAYLANPDEANYALGSLKWVNGQEALVRKAYDAEVSEGLGDIPQTRYVFVGGDDLLKLEAANAGAYNSSDLGEAYIHDYTTIQTPLMLSVQLGLLGKRDYRAPMTLWFEHHTEVVRPWLEQLSDSNSQYKRAQQLLKKL